jgi:hypothetical protein
MRPRQWPLDTSQIEPSPLSRRFPLLTIPPPKLSCLAGRLCTLRDRSFECAVPTQCTRWVVRLCKPGRRCRSLTCSAGPPHHGCAVATVVGVLAFVDGRTTGCGCSSAPAMVMNDPSNIGWQRSGCQRRAGLRPETHAIEQLSILVEKARVARQNPQPVEKESCVRVEFERHPSHEVPRTHPMKGGECQCSPFIGSSANPVIEFQFRSALTWPAAQRLRRQNASAQLR